MRAKLSKRIWWRLLNFWYTAMKPVAKRHGKVVMKVTVKYDRSDGWLLARSSFWSAPFHMCPGPLADRLFITFETGKRPPVYLVMIPTDYEPEFEWWQKVRAFEWEKKEE